MNRNPIRRNRDAIHPGIQTEPLVNLRLGPGRNEIRPDQKIERRAFHRHARDLDSLHIHPRSPRARLDPDRYADRPLARQQFLSDPTGSFARRGLFELEEIDLRVSRNPPGPERHPQIPHAVRGENCSMILQPVMNFTRREQHARTRPQFAGFNRVEFALHRSRPNRACRERCHAKRRQHIDPRHNMI